MRQLGAYDVKVSLTATDSDRALAEGSAAVVHPYPEEYRLASGAKPIDGVCAHTGGGVNSTPKRWHNNQGRSIMRTQERWAPWVWLAIALFLLDLTLRRVRLGPSRVLSWYR